MNHLLLCGKLLCCAWLHGEQLQKRHCQSISVLLR